MAYGFEKLEIWQLASDLLVDVHQLTTIYPKHEFYALTPQTRRAANSVCANIAEAVGRHYFKDKIRTLYIARGEIQEVKSHLLISVKLGYSKSEVVDQLLQRYSVLEMKLNSFVARLAQRSS